MVSYEADDEKVEARTHDFRRLHTAELLSRADEPSLQLKEAVLEELGRRRSPAYRDLLLALCLDPDVEPEYRLHLMRTGWRADRATRYAVWWLILHSDGGGFEHQEHHHQAVNLMSSADRDQSGEAEGLISIVKNTRLAGRYRALAGADLLEGLGPDGLPLLLTCMGEELVTMLEEAADDSRATNLLCRLAECEGLDPSLRLDAATAYSQDCLSEGEGLFADIVTSEGIDLATRMTALEHAVDAADSAAASSALTLLRAVLQVCPDLDDQALSQGIAELRD